MPKDFVKLFVKAIIVSLISLVIPSVGFFMTMLFTSEFTNDLLLSPNDWIRPPNDWISSPIESIFYIVSIIIGIKIKKKFNFGLKEVGINAIKRNSLKPALFFLPLIIFYLFKAVMLFSRFNIQINYKMVLLIFGTATAVINEELYFRGIILTLFRKNINIAIIISTILFGVIHFSRIGIINALFLGLAFAVITILTESIFPSIIFHFVHNIMVFITDFSGLQLSSDGYVAILQETIMLSYAIILWKKINNKSSPNIA
jgi:membrane protease YdiL (CAAX protease family)